MMTLARERTRGRPYSVRGSFKWTGGYQSFEKLTIFGYLKILLKYPFAILSSSYLNMLIMKINLVRLQKFIIFERKNDNSGVLQGTSHENQSGLAIIQFLWDFKNEISEVFFPDKILNTCICALEFFTLYSIKPQTFFKKRSYNFGNILTPFQNMYFLECDSNMKGFQDDLWEFFPNLFLFVHSLRRSMFSLNPMKISCFIQNINFGK